MCGKRVGGIPDGACQPVTAAVLDGGNPDGAGDRLKKVDDRLLQLCNAGRLKRLAGIEIRDLPDVTLFSRQFDFKRLAGQNFIDAGL